MPWRHSAKPTGIRCTPTYGEKDMGCDDAQDLTQGFFAWLLEKNIAGKADRERGKFRSFLLASFNHFLAKEWRRAAAQKRGGGHAVLSLDLAAGESPLQPANPRTSSLPNGSLRGAGH